MGWRCFVCRKEMSGRASLLRHCEDVHKLQTVDAVQYQYLIEEGPAKCLEGCGISYKYTQNLRVHLQDRHNILQEFIETSFSTLADFKVWVKEEEAKCNVKYNQTKHRLKKDDKGLVTEVMHFDCVRSGNQAMMPVGSKRKQTCQTTIHKHTCTSQIIVKVTKGNCLVQYYKTHYGHDKNLQHTDNDNTTIHPYRKEMTNREKKAYIQKIKSMLTEIIHKVDSGGCSEEQLKQALVVLDECHDMLQQAAKMTPRSSNTARAEDTPANELNGDPASCAADAFNVECDHNYV